MLSADSGSPQQELYYALVAQLLGGFTQSMQRAMLAQYGSYSEIFTQSAAAGPEVAAIE